MNMLAAIARIAAILLVLAVTLSRGQLLGGLSQASASLANGPRIQCEYKDIDGESLVLNCTLVTGLSSSQTPSADSNVANVPVNSLEQGLSSSGGPGSSSHLSIRVGIDKHWPTPWEQLYINRNIIRTVIWRNSRLTEIGPYAFKELTSFQRLDLSYNRLTVLNSSAFKQQEVDLIDLDLSHNMFTYIPGELFENKRVSRSLETLRMNENPITAVTKGSLQALRSSLRLIELNYCQIRAIDIDAFDGMQQLESISLVGNHLRHLNQHTFADLTLRSFYVHENPLVCDCHMRWLIDYLKTVDYQQQSYESQLTIVSTTRRYQAINMNSRSQQSSSGYMGGTMSAAQNALRCDQPNSLKSKPNFLEINPDSFMCDIQLSFRDNIYESTFELGEDAVLVCDVYGDPEPEVYWSFGQRPIEKALSNEIDKYYVTEMRGGDSTHAFKSLSSSASASRLSNKTSELRIRDLQPSDMGLYTCTAEIKGSNNRKQIVFSVKQVKRAATSLSNAGDMFINGVNSALTQLLNVIANLAGLQTNSGKPAFHNANQAQSISSTLALLVSILISICVFLFIICVFTCWRLRCCCCRSKRGSGQKRQLSKADMKKHMMMGDGSEEDLVRKEQQEKLLSASGAGGNDQHDGQSSRQNYVSLVNDSSATLLSSSNGHNTKASNSIRMAYPNYSSQQHNHLNDIYANHSLLTTTSSATCVSSAYPGPLPPPPPPPPAHAIAIDTSNHTPRYHLLQQQQQQQIDCYYDDLRYNGDEIARISPTMNPSVIYSSPYRHNSNLVNPTQSYSPIIRRDDPTVPLYATLKPKLIHHQQQQQQHQAAQINRNLNNYVHYSTIHRTQVAPAAKPRQFVNAPAVYSIHPHHQMLPPPPPPPPAPVPPVKPKRTFEYVVMGAQRGEDELNSESGAFLLDQASVNENELNNKLKLKAKNRKKSKHYQYNKDQGSTTSLDEDLDLNDLKDFEDVTFDNLRKPGEDPKTTNQKQQQPQKPQIAPVQTPQVVKPTPETATITEVPKYKTNLSIRMQDLKQDTNSEQSLLLKSSSSSESKCSSDNTINNICAASNSTNTTSATNASNELRSSSEINAAGSSSSSSSSSGSNVQIEEQTIQTTTGKGENVGGKTENNLMENVVDELSSKIYEETEI